jgi:hypothetical protein
LIKSNTWTMMILSFQLYLHLLSFLYW